MFLGRPLRGFIILLFCFCSSAQASWRDVHPCLSRHIQEAMALNKKRAPVYMALSNGQSHEISQRLIGMERKLVLLSPLADAWAAPFQMVGIPILCQDFVDMSQTPSFRSSHPEGPISLDRFQAVDVDEMQKGLRELLTAREYQALAEFADLQIALLQDEPRFHCMLRHILESIRRMAALTPRYEEQAKQKIKISPAFLSRTILNAHIRLLNAAADIDKLAAPLQAQGLPIVCQDVPPIPWP